MKIFLKSAFFTFVLFFCSSHFAFAHINPADHNSFSSGFFHPLTGADHILVMVAVGLWAAQLGGRALWAVPLAFVVAMGAGFMLALDGISLPFVEPAILASVVAIGLLTAIALRLPTGIAMAVVAVFAAFHGHAHGNEFSDMGTVGYGFGFAVATVLLHMLGIVIGLGGSLLSGREGRYRVTRIGGVLTTFSGLYLAFVV